MVNICIRVCVCYVVGISVLCVAAMRYVQNRYADRVVSVCHPMLLSNVETSGSLSLSLSPRSSPTTHIW